MHSYSHQDLLVNRLPPLTDSKVQKVAQDSLKSIQLETHSWSDASYESFCNQAIAAILAHKYNTITGLENYSCVDVLQGNQHYIDSLLIQYGVHGVQTFENDYAYYRKITPNIQYAQVGKLESTKPLIIAAPMPGYMGLHPQWDAILDECEQKGIDVHIDGAWWCCSHGLTIDLNRECIKSFSISLSKALDLGWNRVAIRWRKDDILDNAALLYDFKMISHATIEIARYHLEQLSVDYFIDTYLDEYNKIVRELKLRPGKVIHAASSIDRYTLYGLKNLLTS
jgi:hypothetical protein